MSRISIDIADDLLLALREHPQEVAQEMRVVAAVHYFQNRRLSLGQAARLAGMPRLDFLDVLSVHGLPAFDLSAEDARAEIAAARQVSPPMIVSNATPLIAFARIGELALLERIVQELTLPQAVWQEVTEASERPGAETIREATRINVQAVSRVSPDLLVLLDNGSGRLDRPYPGRLLLCVKLWHAFLLSNGSEPG